MSLHEYRLYVAIGVVALWYVTIILLLKWKWRFRSAVLAAYFLATGADLMLNIMGVSTAFAYIILYRKLEQGVMIIGKIPLIASTIILLKMLLFFIGSYVFDAVKEGLPEFLKNPLREWGENSGKEEAGERGRRIT